MLRKGSNLVIRSDATSELVGYAARIECSVPQFVAQAAREGSIAGMRRDEAYYGGSVGRREPADCKTPTQRYSNYHSQLGYGTSAVHALNIFFHQAQSWILRAPAIELRWALHTADCDKFG
jgi:hypothetical protein